MKSVVLTGGGTAGHVMPNLALLPELYKHFENVYYIAGNGLEKQIVPEYGLQLFQTDTVKFDRENLLSNVKIPFILAKAVKEAKEILKSVDCGVVFSKGGYASLPTVIGAYQLKIPVIIHESDLTMGIANKFASRYADRVLTSFPETDGGEFVGNPIRQELFDGNKQIASKLLKLDTSKKTILVFGGSIGAKAINDVIMVCIDELCKYYNLIHITGKNYQADKGKHANNYVAMEFCDNMGDLYALADLVIMRGGANSLTEVACLGKRAIVIPLPKGNSRGDQVENAKSFAKRGLVTMIEQTNLNKDILLATIKYALTINPPQCTRNDVNKRIVDIILTEYSKKID